MLAPLLVRVGPAKAAHLALGAMEPWLGGEWMVQGGDYGFEHHQAPLGMSPEQNPLGDGAPV